MTEWKHGPIYDFFREGQLVDQWAFDALKKPDEALQWHNRYFSRLKTDEAKRV